MNGQWPMFTVMSFSGQCMQGNLAMHLDAQRRHDQLTLRSLMSVSPTSMESKQEVTCA